MPSRIDRPKIVLVPFDPDSKDHGDRMYVQRVACGWRAHQVRKWQEKQRQGKINLHWITLAEDFPDRESQLKKHIQTYPDEATEIKDTAETFAGKPRVPPTPPLAFLPIGHISLDSETDDSTQADGSRGIYAITTFYVSRVLQQSGIGRAAMDAVEAMAIREPLCARTLTLDTMANEFVVKKEVWGELNILPPKASMQDWFARRGYEVYKEKKGCYKDLFPADSKWSSVIVAVFMKKDVSRWHEVA